MKGDGETLWKTVDYYRRWGGGLWKMVRWRRLVRLDGFDGRKPMETGGMHQKA